MKRTISTLLIIGLLGFSAPISQAADSRPGVKLTKITKKPVKRSAIKYSPRLVKAVYITTDTSTALTPIDTRTATTPVDTHTVTSPAPAPTLVPTSNTALASLSGDQLIKILELFAKLSGNTSTNANTTTNNVLTPITVAPQVITQTIVSPTVSTPTTINQPVAVAQPLPVIAQALSLLGNKENDHDESHEKHK